MKHCKSIQDKLMLFLERELDEKEKNEVKNHLQNCGNCQKELAALKAITGQLQQEPYDLPTSYGSQLIVTLNEKLSRPKWSLGKLVPSVSLVFAGLLIIISLIFTNGNDENIWDQDYLLYQTYGGENLYYDINAADLDTEISASVMPDTYFNITREYLLENTETLKSENINEVFGNLDDETFRQLIENIKSTEI